MIPNVESNYKNLSQIIFVSLQLFVSTFIKAVRISKLPHISRDLGRPRSINSFCIASSSVDSLNMNCTRSHQKIRSSRLHLFAFNRLELNLVFPSIKKRENRPISIYYNSAYKNNRPQHEALGNKPQTPYLFPRASY